APSSPWSSPSPGAGVSPSPAGGAVVSPPSSPSPSPPSSPSPGGGVVASSSSSVPHTSSGAPPEVQVKESISVTISVPVSGTAVMVSGTTVPSGTHSQAVRVTSANRRPASST